MNAVDTNIWIYIHDRRDPRKQQIARDLIARLEPIWLPWQVGCEFISSARKLEREGFTQDDAWAALGHMRDLAERIIFPDVTDWQATEQLCRQLSVSFWDALLITCCRRAGVTTLYSEDLVGAPPIEGMTIISPF